MARYLMRSDKVISLTGFEPVCDSAQAPVPAATEDLETRTMTQRQQRRAAGKSSSTARTARKAKSGKGASAPERKSTVKRAKPLAAKPLATKPLAAKTVAAKTVATKAAAKKAPAKKATAAKAAVKKAAVKPATKKATAVKAVGAKRPATKTPAQATTKMAANKTATARAAAAKPAAAKTRKGAAAPQAKPARTKAARGSGKTAPKRSRPKTEAPRYLAAELGQPVDRHGEPIGAVSALAQGDRQLQDYAMKLWRQMQHGRVMNMYTRAVERAGFTMDDVWLVGLGGRPTSSSPDEMRRYRQKLLFRANLLEAILSETVIDLHRLEGFHPTPKPGEEAASDATATPDAG